jgi:TonB family protein
MKLYGVSASSIPDNPSTAGKWFDLVGTLVICIFFTAIYPLAVHAQKTEGTGRKLLYRVDPQYPVILKASRIGGVVRLNVSISPAGVVQKVSPLGGSSPLVDAAVTAVKKWKYEPAFGWTNMEVRLQFIP